MSSGETAGMGPRLRGDRILALGAAMVSGGTPFHRCGGSEEPPRIKPIERLVPVSYTGCPASTSGLSTWWSSTALIETWF